MAILVSNSDRSVVNRIFKLTKDVTTIGRHPECDVVIDENSVSRRHAQILLINGSYYVQDLDSRNGTLVNKELIYQQTRLFDNAEIEICDVSFVFHTDDDLSYVKPRPTTNEKSRQELNNSFLLEDVPSEFSSIRQKLDLPSHYGSKALSVDRSSLATKESGTEKKLMALMTVTQAIKDAHEPKLILQNVLDSLFELFVEADRGFVAMRDQEGIISPFAMKTRNSQDSERVRISKTIVNQVLDTQQAILSSDAATDQRFDLSQSIVDFRIRSLMCAPLINSEGIAIGVIQLDTLRSAIAFDEGDLEVLAAASIQSSLALQNVELYERVEKNRRLEDDLRLANEVQKRFLPQQPPEYSDYNFFSFYRPMSQVGGDYYDFIRLDENRMAIVVADVVGHGIAAAMLMAKISAESRFAIALNSDPVKAIRLVNQNLSNLHLDKFVTLVMGLIDCRDHSLTLVNAGHMLPILISNTGTVSEVAFEGAGLFDISFQLFVIILWGVAAYLLAIKFFRWE